MLKRMFDLCFAIVATTLMLPFWLLIAVIIKCSSKGPILYRARRVGKDGKLFTLYKFRSMQADSGAIKITTLKNDSRVFPFGKFLRVSKLDETPQFINILLGQMSVVGPRPEDEANADKLFVGEYQKIVSVKPGLTSPASLFDYLFGEQCETEEQYIQDFLPNKLKIELYYVQNHHFWYDIQIALRTAVAIFCTLLLKTAIKYPPEYHLACAQPQTGVKALNISH